MCGRSPPLNSAFRLYSRWCAVMVAATFGPWAFTNLTASFVVMCSSTILSVGLAAMIASRCREMNTGSRYNKNSSPRDNPKSCRGLTISTSGDKIFRSWSTDFGGQNAVSVIAVVSKSVSVFGDYGSSLSVVLTQRRPYDNEGVLTRGNSTVLPAFFGIGLCQSLSKTRDREEDHEKGQNGRCRFSAADFGTAVQNGMLLV